MRTDESMWVGGELLPADSHHVSGKAWRKFLFSDTEHSLHVVVYRLAPGAKVGVHLQTIDELYVILSGRGMMHVNGEERELVPGNAVLTLAGERHGIRNIGDEELLMLVVN